MFNLGNLDRKSVQSPKKKKRKYSVDGNANSFANPNASGVNQGHQSHHNGSFLHGNSASANQTINIIDRVIDLGKYDKNVGLYTLCRDWINATTSINPARSRSATNDSKNSPVDANTEDENSYSITKLPEPVSSSKTTDLEEITKLNEHIKNNIKCSESNDVELIKSLNVDEVIQTHALLKLHVNRWKQSRKEWLNYYKKSNEPYKNSYDTLKSIFEDM